MLAIWRARTLLRKTGVLEAKARSNLSDVARAKHASGDVGQLRQRVEPEADPTEACELGEGLSNGIGDADDLRFPDPGVNR